MTFLPAKAQKSKKKKSSKERTKGTAFQVFKKCTRRDEDSKKRQDAKKPVFVLFWSRKLKPKVRLEKGPSS
jgi:thioredoxin-like negative regulator of GroEL